MIYLKMKTCFCRRTCSLSIWSLRRSGADVVSSLINWCSSIWLVWIDNVTGDIIGLGSNGIIRFWLIWSSCARNRRSLSRRSISCNWLSVNWIVQKCSWYIKIQFYFLFIYNIQIFLMNQFLMMIIMPNEDLVEVV